MAEDQESQEEKLARRQMAEALELFEKKPDQGIEAMRNLLEVYPDFMEARQWLADYYEEADETRLAVSQYEQMLRIEPENDEVWEGLERVDPPTAKRLRRFRNVAPDPFLSGSEAEGAADLDDFENEDEEFQQAAEEPSGQFSGAETSDDIFLEDEGDDYDYEPLAWAHEEDPEYRDQLDKNSAFVDVLDGFMLFWDDPQGWSHLLGQAL